MTLFHACWTVYDDYEKLWDYDFYDVKGLCVQKLWPVTFTRVDMHRSSKIMLHVPTPHMRMSIELHGCLTVAGPDASQAVELPCPGVKSPRPRPLWIPVVRARIGGEQIGRLLLSSDRRPRRDRLGHSR